MRSAVKTGTGGKAGIVVVDVPIDDQMIQYLHDQTAVRAGAVTTEEQAARTRGTKQETSSAKYPSGVTLLWTKSVTQLDYRDWTTGAPHRATMAISYRLGELYKQLASAQSFVLNGMLLADAILVVVVVIAILFLIIEAVALLMGLALAKSITSSVHELFTGTERVRHGDFTHRINIQSRDQLGELADSFNQMTGQHREPAADCRREEASRRRVAHRAADSDVAAAARVARVPGHRASPRCASRRVRLEGTTTTSFGWATIASGC